MKRQNRTVVWVLVGCGVFAACGFATLFGVGVWVGWKRAQALLAPEPVGPEVVFAAPVLPTADEAAEFGRVLDAIGDDLQRRDAAAVAGAFDCDRLADELVRLGVLDRIPGGRTRQGKTELAEGMRREVGTALVANDLFRFGRTEVRRVRWAADRTEAVVIATHRDGDDTRMKMRWWLVARPGGWRVYDLEDLDAGMRWSRTMDLLVTPEFVRDLAVNPDPFKAVVADVQAAAAALFQRKDAAEAERALARCRGRKLPAPLAALRELVEGGLLLEQSDPLSALARFDEAERLFPGMSVVRLCRAAVFNLIGRYDEAAGLARGYVRDLGPDALAFMHEGVALEGLGREAEAADAFRNALDDNPDEAEALNGLRRVLSAEDKGELADRVGRATKAGELFDRLVWPAREDHDAAGVRALVAGLRKVRPNDPRASVEELRDLVTDEKYAAAAAMLRTRLAATPAADRPRVLNAYLFAMSGAGKAAEAYAAVPEDHAVAAFRLLAGSVWDDDDGPTPEAAADTGPAQTLDQLIAAHREHAPDDPWLWYYEAVLLQAGKKYAEAEMRFAAGAAKLPASTGPDDPEQYAADQFRSRRVECRYVLKQGLTAYAEVGPAGDTFRQLANRYDGDNDAAGLAALVAAHAKSFPDEAVLTFWRAQVHYLKKEYAAAAAGFRAYRKVAGEKDAERYRTANNEVRSLIRAGNVAGARLAVTDIGADNVSAGLRAAVPAAAGDVGGVERLMADQAAKPGGVFMFYSDEDFVRLTAGEKFTAVLKKYPDPRTHPPADKPAVTIE